MYILSNNDTISMDILHWLKSKFIKLILDDILLCYTAIFSDNLK